MHYNAVLPWAAVMPMLVVVAGGFVGKNLLQEARAGLKARERGLKTEGLTDAEVERLFREALAGKNYDPEDVEARRANVHAYIRLMHHAEHLYDSGPGR